VECLAGADAAVHLAAIPASDIHTEETTFRTSMLSTFEEHPPLPQSSYALSKLLAEEAARQPHRRSGIPYVSLRFSNIMEPHDYERFPSSWDDPTLRRWTCGAMSTHAMSP
jgi:NAD dependent epimerase/dehydratase family